MPCKARAFSLVELSAVLAIAAVLLLMALPSFNQLRDHARTRSASHLLGTSLASARVMAVNRQIPYSVCPLDAAGRCRRDGVWDLGWQLYRDPRRSGQPANSGDIVHRVAPAPGVRVRSSLGRSHARFLPDGRSSGSNLTVLVCSGHRKVEGARLVVSNGGRLRTERLPLGHPDCVGA